MIDINAGMNRSITSNTAALVERFKQHGAAPFAEIYVDAFGAVYALVDGVSQSTVESIMVESLGVLTMGYAHLAELSQDIAKHPEYYSDVVRPVGEDFAVDGPFMAQLEAIGRWIANCENITERAAMAIMEHWIQNQSEEVLSAFMAIPKGGLDCLPKPVDINELYRHVAQTWSHGLKDGVELEATEEELAQAGVILERAVALGSVVARTANLEKIPGKVFDDVDLICCGIRLLSHQDIQTISDQSLMMAMRESIRQWSREDDKIYLPAEERLSGRLSELTDRGLTSTRGLAFIIEMFARDRQLSRPMDNILCAWLNQQPREDVVAIADGDRLYRTIRSKLQKEGFGQVENDMLELQATARELLRMQEQDTFSSDIPGYRRVPAGENPIVGLRGRNPVEQPTGRMRNDRPEPTVRIYRGRELPPRRDDHSYAGRETIGLFDPTPSVEQLGTAIRALLDAADTSPLAAQECHEAIVSLINRSYDNDRRSRRGRSRY